MHSAALTDQEVISTEQHHAEDLIRIFDSLFRESYNTVLIRGDEEPIYLPADEQHPHHRIVFAHGYFASALHEISHWCIAGPKRRMLEDFGYWYRPDGRTAAQQKEFEQVEIKPQALEWAFSTAACFPFRFSADNLSGEPTDMTEFKHNVRKQIGLYFQTHFPKRARLFIDALMRFYETTQAFGPKAFRALPD